MKFQRNCSLRNHHVVCIGENETYKTKELYESDTVTNI